MSGHEGSSSEYRAQKTSKFLQMEMESVATFTLAKTIQTAISAFQHLFGREVEAHEIRAFSWKDGDIFGMELKQRRKKRTFQELLASFKEPDNDDLDMLTPKKGVAPGVFIPAAGVFSKEWQGDGPSRSSGKSKASETATLFLKKLTATHLKEGRGSRDERRQRKKKVRKSPSKKAMKEIGDDAQDSVEHGAKDVVIPEKDDLI